VRAAAVAVLLCACASAREVDELEQNLDGGCGVERWQIKTGGDPAAVNISTAPTATSIFALTSLRAPSRLPDSDRIAPTELTTWQLADVDLLRFKKEGDGDYHLVLGDGIQAMIAEIADPACVSAASPLLAGILAARAQFEAKYSNIPTMSFATSDETVTLRGVGFFDFKHSQNGVASNGIELHPVTAICFGRGCAPSATPPSGPPAARSGGCATAGDAPLWLALVLLLRPRRATA
jgi:hypothetical protein